jgi:hypothetical protein
MKISYRNQTVLKMLNTGILGPLAVNFQDKNELTDELLSKFEEIWKDYASSFNENVKILSTPFAKAVAQSADKLVSGDLLDEVFLEETSGTLIINDRTICYAFEKVNEKLSELTYYCFQKTSTEETELRCFINLEYDGEDATAQTYIAKSHMYKDDLFSSVEAYTKTLIAILNFIKYADIEVKILPPNKKVKEIDCKYVNETSSNIQFLKSTWFTTLVKSDSFKVRGHFRLQPKKKDGEWTKEIIWINEFEKTGYTSPAKKIDQNG